MKKDSLISKIGNLFKSEPAPIQHIKNVNYGTIHANGDVHIGDVIYNIQRDFKEGSILFLRLDKLQDNNDNYIAQLFVKTKRIAGERWCENIEVNIPTHLFENVAQFQAFRRGVDTQMRYKDIGKFENSSIQATEQHLSRLLFDTFFGGLIGEACKQLITQLEENRIDELLLSISCREENIINLPFEMVLPHFFEAKYGEDKKSLAVTNFGLVRTKITSLDTFSMQGDPTTAAPLKMLFITALPENLSEDGKMLQIEEEQTRLIKAIGNLEVDTKPKIVIEFLENASLEELHKALKNRQHDIVHISGHGAYHKATNKGVLYFENEDGDILQVSGADLGETLRQHACVKLLILSACETAIAGSDGGVTEQAAAYSVPSIVAMRFAVTDEGAKIFTTELYTQLAKGLSLTRALGYAREELQKEVQTKRQQTPHIPQLAEWFTPVVYQNQYVGALIAADKNYQLPDNFYPHSSFLKTRHSRLIGEGFIGRKRYLIQMRKAFQASKHVCLYGLGGLGKTTLSEAFAHNYDNRSHTTIFFRNGHQINEKHILNTLHKQFAELNPKLANQLQAVLDDPKTDVLDKLQALIDNYLYNRKIILVFDNVEDIQQSEGGEYQRSIGSEALSEFLRYLCENTPSDCHIIFTTRYKIEDLADILTHIPLDKMTYAEQYRLLNYSNTLRNIPLTDREAVYKCLDGHPRAYEYLEALLKKDKNFAWAQVAKSEEKIFENLLLAKVYERLNDLEKAIFQVMSVFISRTPIAALAAVSVEANTTLLPILQSLSADFLKEHNTMETIFLHILHSLQDWSLCFIEKDHRFEVHRLTRVWMEEHIISSAQVKEWAEAAGEYFEPKSTWEDKILAKDYFEKAKVWGRFVNISFELQNHFQGIGLYEKARSINEDIVKYDITAEYNAIALSNIGRIHHIKENYPSALDSYNSSLVIFIRLENHENEAATLNNISQIYKETCEYPNALIYLEKALYIQITIGDYEGVGISLSNIGQIHDLQGEPNIALNFYKHALKVQQEIGNRKSQAITLNNISQNYSARGDYDTALTYIEQALEIYYDYIALEKIDEDIDSFAIALTNKGEILFKQTQYEQAIPFFITAYQIFQIMDLPEKAREPDGHLGLIAMQIGESKIQEIFSKMQQNE